MPVTSYRDYIRDLKEITDRIRDKPFEYSIASIETAVYKNGYGYKSRELLREDRLISEFWMGPLNSGDWHTDSTAIGRSEIDEFFGLPEIFAYSDHALTAQRNPLSKAHWDATIGLFEILVCERNSTPRQQRMLFAGFSDSIHAEFFLTVDQELLVHDRKLGPQLFEWQPVDLGPVSAFTTKSSASSWSSPLPAAGS
ncbi:hypothetical protein [Rhizobium sp. GR12]|uniref:hypothetical protein n=1 Tax=Rhizobium sp. GR12 TaxID=3053925 RepID=UPI002FBE53AF